MAVAVAEWLGLIEREYLDDFVSGGGAAVKLVVGAEPELVAVARHLDALARAHGMVPVVVDAAATRLHMIQDVFFAISRALDWDSLAQHFVEAMFARHGYDWPRPGHAVAIQEIAEQNRIDATILRRDVRQWLTADVMREPALAQDFRLAMTLLCQRRLEPEEESGAAAPVVAWLRGELRSLAPLRQSFITARITRHNGRAMLRSLCRWLRLCGRHGLCAVLDIRQLARTGAAVGDGIRYSPSAVMDGFEVLRQLIDDGEHFAGLLAVVLAEPALIGHDPKRSLDAYLALKMRVWDDVRPETRDNPLAPLVRLAGSSAGDRSPVP